MLATNFVVCRFFIHVSTVEATKPLRSALRRDLLRPGALPVNNVWDREKTHGIYAFPCSLLFACGVVAPIHCTINHGHQQQIFARTSRAATTAATLANAAQSRFAPKQWRTGSGRSHHPLRESIRWLVWLAIEYPVYTGTLV